MRRGTAVSGKKCVRWTAWRWSVRRRRDWGEVENAQRLSF